jgi:SH3-like domain-containing protein
MRQSKFQLHLLLVLVIISCKPKEIKVPDITVEKQAAICIVDGISVKEKPEIDSKWFSTLSLGETVYYSGEVQIDNSKSTQKFYKVELADGRMGWVKSYALLLNARNAAVIRETSVYSQPNSVNKTKLKFYPVEFVAVISEQGEWSEVTGIEKRKTGWVSSSNLSTNSNDIAVAVMANKAILNKEGQLIIEKLPDFLKLPEVQNSAFKEYLNNKLDSKVEDAVEKSIQEYENK